MRLKGLFSGTRVSSLGVYFFNLPARTWGSFFSREKKKKSIGAKSPTPVAREEAATAELAVGSAFAGFITWVLPEKLQL